MKIAPLVIFTTVLSALLCIQHVSGTPTDQEKLFRYVLDCLQGKCGEEKTRRLSSPFVTPQSRVIPRGKASPICGWLPSFLGRPTVMLGRTPKYATVLRPWVEASIRREVEEWKSDLITTFLPSTKPFHRFLTHIMNLGQISETDKVTLASLMKIEKDGRFKEALEGLHALVKAEAATFEERMIKRKTEVIVALINSCWTGVPIHPDLPPPILGRKVSAITYYHQRILPVLGEEYDDYAKGIFEVVRGGIMQFFQRLDPNGKYAAVIRRTSEVLAEKIAPHVGRIWEGIKEASMRQAGERMARYLAVEYVAMQKGVVPPEMGARPIEVERPSKMNRAYRRASNPW